jgi:superfamily II DNA or RNA helicase
VRLVKRTEIDRPDKVYNLHVKTNHNYVANGTVVSNCHGADALVLHRLLTQAGRHVPIRIGMTGTMPDDDLSHANIICALGPIVYEKRAKELQDIGFLATCKIFILKYLDRHRPEYEAVRRNHEFYIDESRWQFRNKPRLNNLAAFIEAIKPDGNTLVLLRNREYGEALHVAIPGSIYLNGDDKGTYRHKVYREFNASENGVLICTYGIASTGIDVARLFSLVLIEPGHESVGIVQSIGRGLRKADDKQSVLVYHVGSDCKFSIKHLADVQRIYDQHEYPYEEIEVDY